MSEQTKVRFGPVITSSFGAFYPLPAAPQTGDERCGRPGEPKRRRERHPAGDSSINNAAHSSTPIPPFRTSPVPCDRSSPLSERPSPLLDRPSPSLEHPSPVSEQGSPVQERASPAREKPSPCGSIPTIPEEEEPSSAAAEPPNRKRRHSSGQRVVRRTRTRLHRPRFASRKVDVLGQLQIMCAVLIIIVELLLVTKLNLPGHFPGIGFVAGLCFLVSGGLGILSSCTRKHAQILLCIMTAVIATVVAAFVATFAGLGFMESLAYDDDEEVLNQLLYMLQVVICSFEMFGALGQGLICCCATCCLDCKWRRRATEITVIYATCPTTGSFDDVKKDAKEIAKSEEKKQVEKPLEKPVTESETKTVSDEKEEIDNEDNTSSGCECDMDPNDDDVLFSNEELNEFWVIPRVVRGGSSGHRSRSDSKSSDKRERRSSGASNKQPHMSDSSSGKRERNFSGNERTRRSSAPTKNEKERHDSGLPENTPTETNCGFFDKNMKLEPLVLVSYGSNDTIVRSERGSETSVRGSQQTVGSARNSIASSRNSGVSGPITHNCIVENERTPSTGGMCQNSHRGDSVLVDLALPISQISAIADVNHGASVSSRYEPIAESPTVDQNGGASCDPTEDNLCAKNKKDEKGTSPKNSQASDSPSGQSYTQMGSLQTSIEDTSESSGVQSMSRDSSLETS